MLNLDLQYFAEEKAEEEKEKEEVTETSEKTEKTNESNDNEKLFTQEDVNRMIRERLERERKKREQAAEEARREAERKQLEEKEQYKELAENYRKEIEALKEDALNAKKEILLAKAGYTDEQIKVLRTAIAGETDDELEDAIKNLKTAIPPKPKYVDPLPGNSLNSKPEPKDQTEEGRSRIRDLISRGKIRGMKKHKEEN